MPLTPCLRWGKLGHGSYCARHRPVKPRAHRVRRRRARLRAQRVETVNRQAVYERDGGLCGICGKPCDPESFEIDHRIPVAAGGEDFYANVQVAHPACNRLKAAR